MNHRIIVLGLLIPLLAGLGRLGKPAATAQSQAGDLPLIDGCQVFPPDNIWNTAVDTLPLDPNSSAYVNTIGSGRYVHADFGSGLWNGGPIGIPFVSVTGTQPRVPVSFTWPDESDPGPYPIPPDAPIEGGPASSGDRHVLVLDRDNCVLYEIYNSWPQANGSWTADSGAVFDLGSHALRPETWTSADAAGLPILPGLVRYDEVMSGEITHAIRFTVPQTRRAYVWPARHYASSLTGTQYPPMGQRFRLKAGYDISGFAPEVQVILRAMKKYGIILADNGSAWFISGAPDERWNNDVLRQLHSVYGSAFEAVDSSSLMINPNSGQAGGSATPTPTTPGPTATPTNTPSPTATFTPIPTATFTPTPTLPPSGNDTIYLSSTSGGTAGGVSFANEDLLSYQAGSWALYFDGSDVGLSNQDVDAFSRLADGSLLLSFEGDFNLSGFGAVDDSDILKFSPTSLGSSTAGSFSWYFDGSDVGLTTKDEDVDAFAVTPDGRLVVSTLGAAGVTGASAADEDLLAFTPGQLGATTTGTWALYFDGSDVGLGELASEDINGAWIDPLNGVIVLTTTGNFSVPGFSGDGSDLLACTPLSLGANTACTWALYWDGSASGFAGEVTDAVEIVR